MLDHSEHDAGHPSNSPPQQLQGSYPPQYDQQQNPSVTSEYYQQPYPPPQPRQQQIGAHQPYEQSHSTNASQAETASGIQGPFAMGQVIDPNDPMLDADPFGLSASMHYPTSYSSLNQQAPSR